MPLSKHPRLQASRGGHNEAAGEDPTHPARKVRLGRGCGLSYEVYTGGEVNVWGGCVVAVAPQTFTKSTTMMLSTCGTSMINSAKLNKHQQQAALPVRHT